MQSIRISNGSEAIKHLGAPRLARRKATILKREPASAMEVVQTAWGPQEAHLGVDYVAIQDDGSVYPYKIAEWKQHMEEVPGQTGRFRKKTASRLVEVPADVVVECVTIDGGGQAPLEIRAPDFICIGGADEVYPLSRARFDEEFEYLD